MRFHQDDTLSQLFVTNEVRAANQQRRGGVFKRIFTRPPHDGNMAQLAYAACDRSGKHISPELLGRFGFTVASMIVVLVHENTPLKMICPAEACASNEWRWCILSLSQTPPVQLPHITCARIKYTLLE